MRIHDSIDTTNALTTKGSNAQTRVDGTNTEQVKRGGSRSGEMRTITKVEKRDSFFKFFQNPVMYDEEDEEEDDDEVREKKTRQCVGCVIFFLFFLFLLFFLSFFSLIFFFFFFISFISLFFSLLFFSSFLILYYGGTQ